VAKAVADRSGAYPTAFAATVLLAARWFLESRDDEALDLGLESLRLAEAAADPSQGTEAAGFLAEARAWAATASGRSEPDLWQDAVDAWTAAGFAYPATQARAMLAFALLESGDRDAARAQTVRAWTDADGMDACWLADRVGAFARRARFPLQTAVSGPGPLDVLTPREREVLALLAEGASNRVIAERLYISTKTAGVHVSNLLAKLGVSSRLEAAALAHRNGLAAAD
jgi:DNA-binding CsgD family transcriptional regulator